MLQNSNSDNLIKFSVTTYFYPNNNIRAPRTVFSRNFYHSKKSKDEIRKLTEYRFTSLSVCFNDYKHTKDFDAIDKEHLDKGLI